MELVHSALLLHKAGKEINEENLKKVIEAAGIEVEESKIKALLASLEGVDIDEEISKGSVAAAAPSEGAAEEEKSEEEEKEEEEEGEVSEEEAAEGLGELF